MSRKVLLIDDDRLQYRVTQEHFKGFQSGSYELEWAPTYEAGIARLLTGEFVACLLDYQLGERDGLQLIREAVAAGCHTPIVFLTVEAADRVEIEAMNAGALDYLVKGEITPRTIERSLRYALKLGETLEALRRLATRDSLTGLLNRREFDRILTDESERALRFGRGLGLVMIDVDHFKAINDAHGHQAGDRVLQEVARRLADEMRSVDRATRCGGEEFALIVLETDAGGALKVAHRACAAVSGAPIMVAGIPPLTVTISAGVALLPRDARTETDLVAAADAAMYAAKKRGRNRVVAFDAL